jgi:aerobic carbon-monoxide dehydrogenase large subunit
VSAARTRGSTPGELVRGDARFVGDLAASDALHVAFVRSTVPHARIRAITFAAAAATPGVVAVHTGATCPVPPSPPEFPILHPDMRRSLLPVDATRFVGEALAVVVAETVAAAVDAAELVEVDLDPLPPLVDLDAALAGDVLVHPAAGTNVAFSLTGGDAELDVDACEVAVRVRASFPRVAASPIEARAVLAVPGADGRLTVYIGAQGPHPVRDRLVAVLGLTPDAVRVVCPDVGGAFGAKAFPHPEELLVAWLALELGRPVRWEESRSEAMASLGHGRGQRHDLVLGGRRDGTLERYRLAVVQDGGAHPRIASVIPTMVRMMQPGAYCIAEVAYAGTSVVTTTAPTVAYRGAGRPEATAAVELAVDRFARAVGMDPVEVRRRNLVPADAFPFTSASGLVYDSGDYRAVLDRVVGLAGYDALRAEQTRRRAEGSTGRLLGVGVCCYVEVTSSSNAPEWARVALAADGSALVTTGTSPHGQGHAATWARLAVEHLGGAADAVVVEHGDSDQFPSGTVTAGSRSAQVGGSAVDRAAADVVAQARAVAATLLEASVDDVVHDRGRRVFHVVGTPARHVSLAEVIGAAGALSATVRYEPDSNTCTSGVHLAVVEVDPETGAVELVRFIAADDAGTILDPPAFEGQVQGGVAQGIGQALLEAVVYDADGTLRTGTLVDYALPTAADLPWIETVEVSTPTPANVLGAKGIGESGAVGATPAVQLAVLDALVPLGVVHVDVPLDPQAVWTAIRAAARGSAPA